MTANRYALRVECPGDFSGFLYELNKITVKLAKRKRPIAIPEITKLIDNGKVIYFETQNMSIKLARELLSRTEDGHVMMESVIDCDYAKLKFNNTADIVHVDGTPYDFDRYWDCFGDTIDWSQKGPVAE